MPRSALYVTLLKRLIEASQTRDRALFEKVVQELEAYKGELSEEERFDLDLNIKAERETFETE